jgi:hypothetical protein
MARVIDASPLVSDAGPQFVERTSIEQESLPSPPFDEMIDVVGVLDVARTKHSPSRIAIATVLMFFAIAVTGGCASKITAQPATSTTNAGIVKHTTPKTAASGTPSRTRVPARRRRVTPPSARRASTTTAPRTKPRLIPLTIAPASHQGAYDRDADFGGWIDVDGDCQNTRAEVLIAQTRAPVTFTRASDCTVKNGRWVDPWSGITTTVAHDFDIDHTVPLANAWRSGAWSWPQARRVAYANDLVDPFHLVAIDASENRQKGDDGPESWRPPRPSAWCRYAITWDHIKAKWHLTATPSEWSALTEMARTC